MTARLVILGCLGCISVFSTEARANLLGNGNLAKGPPVSGSGFTTVTKGQKLIPHWTIHRNSVDYATTIWQTPPGATASIDMNGSNTSQNESMNQPGTFTNSFNTTEGKTYSVSFYLSGNPSTGCGPTAKQISVSAGPTTKNYTFDISVQGNSFSNMMWMQETFSFVATDSISFIKFISKTKGVCGPTVGEVSVVRS